MKINVGLFQPEIPQNTGNISRTCSATDSALHLVHPLGFSLDEKHLRRAGLDYWDGLSICEYADNDAFFSAHPDADIWYFSQKGARSLWDVPLFGSTSDEIWLAFGCESQGLGDELLSKHREKTLRIPMLEGKRSLNLSNTVAIAVYEALRQNGFAGLRMTGSLSEGGCDA